VIQKKISRPVQFEITEQTRSALGEWLSSAAARRGKYLFPSRFRKQPHLSMRQDARIVHRWGARAGLDSSAYATHSMRRTEKAISELCSCVSGTRSLRVLSAISVSRSTTRSAFPSKSSCDLRHVRPGA
jgi:hypothetical protein